LKALIHDDWGHAHRNFALRLEHPMMLGSVQSPAGEAPYLKLISQPVGNRILVANVIDCSSLDRGYLPTTPWSQNTEALRLTALVKEASAVRRKTYQHM